VSYCLFIEAVYIIIPREKAKKTWKFFASWMNNTGTHHIDTGKGTVEKEKTI
jgi:hypothetical protein